MNEVVQRRQNDTWSEILAPIVAKFEVGAKFGNGVFFNVKGCEALSKLLKEMAQKLDIACDNE